ncbi:MAG: carboxypeptidase regulatory-like domain-containing protein, partial [Micromonosporaceae bacterium]|nr:carboxypeptidase regulatory-like domain-containing protein [Micromonosporaceae bacterium]
MRHRTPVALVAVLLAPLAVAMPAAAAAATVALAGTVTDGSGHGWPLYAKVAAATADGAAAGSTWTDPVTGKYRLQLAPQTGYTLTVSPGYPGYQSVTRSVSVGDGDLDLPVPVPVSAGTCAAPGYASTSLGRPETFDTGSPPDGWTVVDNLGTGQVWQFGDPFGQSNLTGGADGFTMVDSFFYPLAEVDTALVSPPMDLSGTVAPVIGFRQDFLSIAVAPATADVDVSI